MTQNLKLKFDYINDLGKRELIYEDERGNLIKSQIMQIDNQDCFYVPVDDKKNFVAYPISIEKDVLRHQGKPVNGVK